MIIFPKFSHNACNMVLRKRKIYWDIPEKKQKVGVEDIDLPGVLKKKHVEWKFQGLIKTEVEFPGVFMKVAR